MAENVLKINKPIVGALFIITGLALLVQFLFFGQVLYAKNIDKTLPDDDCLKCHQKAWDQGIAKSYIHKPFIEKKCRFCHIQDNALVERNREFMNDRKVRWLADRRVNTKTHWFKVPLDEINDHVHVEYQAPGQATKRKEIILPQIDELKELIDDKQAPEITDVKIKNLNRGLFLTATVVWKTDELSTSQISYGLKKIKHKTNPSYNFTKNHEVQLSGLKYKKKYKFSIASEDIFGNRAESKTMIFSTAKAKYVRPRSNSKDHTQQPGEMRYKLYRLGDSCVFRIGFNTPTVLALGTPKHIQEIEEDLEAKREVPKDHNLKDALMTNSTICEPCHGIYVKDRNHPINVSAKPGMKVPDDYFVLSNGNITCMTCHASHSSDIEYRLVRSNKRELCIGCHINKI